MRHDQYETAGESPAVESAIKGMIAAARKIVRWFEPRTIPANIILLILTFALPLLISSMYFMVNGIDKDIAAARLEIHGNAYQRPLENLLDEIAVHERVMAGSATTVSGAEQRKQLELQIDSQWRALAFIQQQFGRELQFTNEGLKKRNRDHIEISTVEREWRSLRDARTLSAVDSASKHQHLVKDLRAMIEHSGDTSGLILDPDLDSYYLIDATLKALPQTQDRLAALSSRIRNWPSTVKLSPATRSQLAVVSGFLHESDQDRITGDIDTSLNEDDAFNGRSESLHVNLPPAVKRYVEANQSLAAVIQHALDSADAGSLDDIAAAADRTREASVGLWWVAEPELNRLLATRIFYRQQARTRGILLMGTAVLLPGFFVFLMIRSITRPITQLSGIAVRISLDRDYSVRAPVCGKGETGALITTFNDMLSQIQVHKITEDKLRESEERYAIAAHGANDGLWDWKLGTNEVYFSSRWTRMLGYSDKAIWSDPEDWFSRIHSADRERVRTQLAAHLEGSTTEFSSEYRMRHINGQYIWVLSRGIAVRDANGVAVRIAGSQTDITEGKVADTLTELPNRTYFMDKLERAAAKLRVDAIAAIGNPGASLFAVLFLDLDKFKVVNDNLGHAAGDQLLVGVAQRLRASVRGQALSGRLEVSASTVARLGGDEFAILVEGIRHQDDAAIVAERILKHLGTAFYLDSYPVFASGSIGIATSSSGDTPEELLRNADTAMYHAKAHGGGRFEIFDQSMRERAIARMEIEADLKKAVEAHEFILHYQPKISMIDQQITGFEALVRWNHPTRGLLYPSEFIPVAEETGLIVPLGRWVLGEACRQMAAWHRSMIREPALSISVNVSFKQLTETGLAECVEGILAETGLDPQTLKLEMTESSIMENAKAATATLRRCKELHIGLEIDDFGTGHSSLNYLRQLPFDTVKIDRSFVKELGTKDDTSEIINTILQMARSLGMNVVAEGVETQDQLARLAAMGCASGQGYYFSKPVDAERAHWLIQGKDTPQRGILLKPVPRIGRAKPPESYDFEPALAG